MAGHKTAVKNVKPITDKTTGKTTLKATARKGESVSRKIAARKSTKQKVVSRAKAGRGK
jgi:hypothetical protein